MPNGAPQLRDLIVKRFGHCWPHEPLTMNATHRAYLNGLNDAGVAGAKELLDLIEKHDAIQVWCEN